MTLYHDVHPHHLDGAGVQLAGGSRHRELDLLAVLGVHGLDRESPLLPPEPGGGSAVGAERSSVAPGAPYSED